MEGRAVSHYRVGTRLASGGMGVVYRAQDLRLNRSVALKFLPQELTTDDEARERFVQEAQSASALDHPNICTVHDIDTADDGQIFMVMSLYEGQTVKQMLDEGPIPIDDAVTIASQVLRGLEKAHQSGIVHRDIKPANVVITSDGLVKILDFGIAKLLDRTGPTRTGTLLGTIAYMAPEQINGAAIDSRTDIWAVGVLLYQMLTGIQPFRGENEAAIIHEVLHHVPPPPASVQPGIPAPLSDAVMRAMSRDVNSRFPSAQEFAQQIAACVQTVSVKPARRSMRWAPVTAIVLIGSGAWAASLIVRSNAERHVEALLQRAMSAADQDDNFAALAALAEFERLAPTDTRIAQVSERATIRRDLTTQPDEVEVYLKPFDTPAAQWSYAGRTPLKGFRMAREPHRIKLEKTGYVTVEALSTGGPMPVLVERKAIPEGTVYVPAGPLSLTLTLYNYTQQISAPAFAIDKYEVTNRRFKVFVDAGGYTKPEYWSSSFVRDGRPMSWPEAMQVFRDKTGRAGPAGWEVGSFPAGQEDFPVTGVSWYEAEAFARYSGRHLPTAYHWLRAASLPQAANLIPLSNLNGKALARGGEFPAVSDVGSFDMAGNAKEWCSNQVTGHDERLVLGGSWRDPTYAVTFADARQPFDRSDDQGFRLVTYLSEPPASALAALPQVAKTTQEPASDEVFAAYRALYQFDPFELDARVEGRDETNANWIKEKVSFRSAVPGVRMTAYMLLPRHARPPYQALIFAPTGAAIAKGDSSTLRDPLAFTGVVQSGRAVIYPIYDGTYERYIGFGLWPLQTRAYSDWLVRVTNEGRLAAQYLRSRADIKKDEIGVLAASWGIGLAVRLLALDSDFKAAVLMDGGLRADAQKEFDLVSYFPRIRIPVLMINGNSDFIFPVESSQKPAFAILGSPAARKRHVVLPGGHYVIGQQRNQVVREILDWLDLYLGPVTPAGAGATASLR